MTESETGRGKSVFLVLQQNTCTVKFCVKPPYKSLWLFRPMVAFCCMKIMQKAGARTTFIHQEATTLRKHVCAIFHGCKSGNFQMKNCGNFLIFAQNIDCGYTLEPPE